MHSTCYFEHLTDTMLSALVDQLPHMFAHDIKFFNTGKSLVSRGRQC